MMILPVALWGPTAVASFQTDTSEILKPFSTPGGRVSLTGVLKVEGMVNVIRVKALRV